MRVMTFTIPDEIADSFLQVVPVTEQSGVVAELMRRAARPPLTEEEWEAAARSADDDPVLKAEMEEWQAFDDPIEESWHESPSR